MSLVSVGIDPGPATGIFTLDDAGWTFCGAYQCTAVSAQWLLHKICYDVDAEGVPCGVEEFRKGAKRLGGQYPEITRDLVTALSGVARQYGMRVEVRPAATVKPWATDQRLERAGLLALTGHGMPHARDASRHALYAAVHAGKMPDPLSRKGRGDG